MSRRKATDLSFRHRIAPFFTAKEGNFKVIILCIIAATTFWFFSALNKSDYTTQINYPISFVYASDSTYPLSQLPEEVRLQVNGGGWDLLRKTLLVDVRPIEVTLDEPTRVKYITGQSLAGDIEASLGDVRLEYILTDTLRINIDSVLTKEVVVAVDSASVDLEENHWITSSILLKPQVVRVVGPASVIRQAPDTLTVSIPDQEIAEDYEETLPLSYTSPLAEVIPDEADVQFEVDDFVVFNRSVPLIKLNFPIDSSAFLVEDRVKVNFWVKESLVDDMIVDSTDFRVVVDFSKARQDSTLVPIVTKKPSFIKNLSVEPRLLRLRYDS